MTTALPSTVRTQLYIAEQFVDAEGAATFDNISPATGRVINTVAAASESDVDRAVAAARKSFDDGTWSRIAPAERKAVLLKFADLIEKNADELALIDSIDAGKPITDCEQLDIPDVVLTVRWYAEAIDKVFGKVSPTGPDNIGLVVREPAGVVAVVVPWNFPSNTLSWKIGPALAAGNSIVVKPAELSPLSALRYAELATEAGIPSGVFNVVPGLGHIAGKALGLHHDVDVVTFTGSTEVGRMFLKYAADSNLKQVALEMGGKSPQIVFGDMRDELEKVASDLADAAFWNGGQNCSAGSRILVHNSIKGDFVKLMAELASGRKVGNPLDRATEIGPLIEASARDRVLGYIDNAKAAGSTVYGGGRILDETGGFFVSPAVIDHVGADDAVVQEEIFGPVVAVLGFDTEEQAIALANDTVYGLAANVWTRDINVALRVARAVRAGTVAVNGFSEGDISTPFGGFGLSGFGGHDKGLEAFDQYTELKTIWITLH
ncbi:aldehyde dehydrogenase [Rhodococcus sp. 06-156-3C]|uniref:aldehyde dehydrogenase n=1 Tax=Nocardiaceae TaxID=85025 RepID=UPI000522F141|nr:MULTISPECIES: aldehyde dehydrogenase [Rhodococcus]OZD18222.1 aldehyde dehydrogenase [Rhodococcus sp. 06-156-4C]OZD18820.1 aldehyde dehydrogenase [Rhodococcus sp. 06-156-3C]OZD22330.1 aldehyde dehydrogenase [Rhodococcus sp. 06-156-4a]OZD34136.1 aldehyde dehydrogenase [Rhodococcus sp. 06-156-3b]OZD38873.1 aldehyde dehydrogenase [Rhodococcus sp. 06-156-3]